MRMTKRLVCLLAALMIAVPVVALPATALGQSAGDDQYVDPFQNNGNGNNDNSGSGSQSNGNSDSNTSASQQTTQTTAPTGDTAGATAQDPSASGTLPRTGEDLGGVALMGVLLVGGGFALRRAWPLPE